MTDVERVISIIGSDWKEYVESVLLEDGETEEEHFERLLEQLNLINDVRKCVRFFHESLPGSKLEKLTVEKILTLVKEKLSSAESIDDCLDLISDVEGARKYVEHIIILRAIELAQTPSEYEASFEHFTSDYSSEQAVRAMADKLRSQSDISQQTV